MEAIAASTVQRDPRGSLTRVDRPALAERDPGRLVRNDLDLSPVQPPQRIERRRFRVQPEPPCELYGKVLLGLEG